MNHLIETITQYKTKSADPIRDQQIAYIPRLETDQIDYTVSYYILNGIRVSLNITNQLFIRLKYLKFRSISPKKALQYRTGIFYMETLVNDKIINPFMLFIDGYFIPWEYINIVMNNGVYHIIIDSGIDDHYINLCKKYNSIQIVTLPEYTTCVKDYTGNSFDAMFVFNSKGEFDPDNIKYAITTFTNKYKIGFNYWHTNTAVNAFPLLNQTDVKLTKDNIIIFVNGLFATGTRKSVKRAIDAEVERPDGKICHCKHFTSSNDTIIQNPSIRIDSSLLTINDGINPKSDVYDFALFVNAEYTRNIDNISRISLAALSNSIKEFNSTGIAPEYYNDLSIPFKMKMDRNKYYNENIIQSIKTIMNYNSSLLNQTIREKSNLVIEEYTGEWIHSKLRYDGSIMIPISHSDMVDEAIVIFVNGELYKYSYMANYYANKVSIPIQNISYDDSVELFRFKNINNNEMQIVINQSDGYLNYSDSIINENMVLFCKECNTAVYEYPQDGLQHFEVDYTLEYDTSGKIKIVLTEPYYYGKSLTIAYKNRFKHCYFNISTESEYDEFIINLGDEFMYCSDYSKYIVFLNGRRLLSDYYRLVIPTRPTAPFYEFKIYLTTNISTGDRLDIVYAPNIMQDIVINNTIDTSGDIIMDKSILDYGISTDLYMVWINGKKIPISHIKDIDSTHMRIVADEESTSTVCITKYIPNIDILNDIFDDNTSIWDSIIANMTENDINNLLGINTSVITNTERDIYENAVDIKAIMHELIRDQFLNNPRVDVTGTFIYDYTDIDNSISSNTDDNGNIILSVADANNEDNLITIDREYP